MGQSLKYLSIILLFFGCSTKTLLVPTLSYTSTNFSLEELDRRYKKVPIHRGQDIDDFVKQVAYADAEPLVMVNNGYNNFQVFIDEQGRVESIFKLQKSDTLYDQMAVDAIKRTEFKPLRMDGKPTKYAVFMSFSFNDHDKIYPVINGMWSYLKMAQKKRLNLNTSDQTQIFPSEDVTVKPTLLKGAFPRYPDLARKSGVEGVVEVKIIIDETGNVINSTIHKSLPMLDAAALEAADKCKFSPGFVDGQPVRVCMTIPFHFKLSR
ncbi:MAG: TonB family protein [Caldithrix sp.]|nr:TonB family protein [Caldithrix sp.]